MASAHPECVLWTLAVIFLLYVVCDVLSVREQIASYDPALAGVARATAAQIWNVYSGAFAGRSQVSPGPAITLAWTFYFVLLAIAGNGRAYAHIRTTCVFALIGLLGYWVDMASLTRSGTAAMACPCVPSSSWPSWRRQPSISGSCPTCEPGPGSCGRTRRPAVICGGRPSPRSLCARPRLHTLHPETGAPR
jgi:hypothetical protein